MTKFIIVRRSGNIFLIFLFICVAGIFTPVVTRTFVLKSPQSPRAEVIGFSERFTLLAGTLKKGGKAGNLADINTDFIQRGAI